MDWTFRNLTGTAYGCIGPSGYTGITGITGVTGPIGAAGVTGEQASKWLRRRFGCSCCHVATTDGVCVEPALLLDLFYQYACFHQK